MEGPTELYFEFQLAHDLGMTLAELRRRLSCREFVEWLAWYKVRQGLQEEAQKKAERAGRRK